MQCTACSNCYFCFALSRNGAFIILVLRNALFTPINYNFTVLSVYDSPFYNGTCYVFVYVIDKCAKTHIFGNF